MSLTNRYSKLVLAVLLIDAVVYFASYTVAGGYALEFWQIFGWAWVGVAFQSIAPYALYMYFFVLMATALVVVPSVAPRSLLDRLLMSAYAYAGKTFFGCFLVTATLFGITSCANIVEIYRRRATEWNDSLLWHIEEPLFEILLAHQSRLVVGFDFIYNKLWVFLMLALGVITHHANAERQTLLAITVMVAFLMTRLLALFFPTQGPAFFMPGFFVMPGTDSAEIQKYLDMFMRGMAPQFAGLYPGTMAMPSLHVGLTALAGWFIWKELSWTIWLIIPWFCLSWGATVALGWHYLSDGVGGLFVVFASYWLSKRYLRLLSGRSE